jgi:TolB protein
MIKYNLTKYCSYLFLILTFSFNSYGIQTIVIDRGNANPTPIAINHFDADGSAENLLGNNIVNVISNDLKKSGLFHPISSTAFIERKKGIEYKPLFAAWRQINADLLVNGNITKLPSGKIKVSFKLWDTILEKDLVSEYFEVSENLWRRVAHKIADEIYEKLSGDKGYFDTKIVYVSEFGPHLKRLKRIAIMDHDGANHQYLTDDKHLVLTPRFSPKSDQILYLSYIKRTPRVYVRDLKTGKESVIGDFPGMSFAPRFSHDGNRAIMSVTKNAATHIFEIDLNTKRVTQLTDGYSINTSPSYSPDDKKIVFNSDRSGARQLYVMNSDGSNVERISFGGGAYAAPTWSPRGDYIAFTKITRGEGFTIGVMKSPTHDDGNNSERIIANGYLVEGPSWAPNGRVIMYAKTDQAVGKAPARTRIYTIDLTGHNEQEIPTLKDASDPEWSRTLE